MEVFDKQMQIIKDLGYNFYDPKFFVDEFAIPKKEKILITIDDGFKSFYNEAWPYLKKIKFHLYFLYLPNLWVNLDICHGKKLKK